MFSTSLAWSTVVPLSPMYWYIGIVYGYDIFLNFEQICFHQHFFQCPYIVFVSCECLFSVFMSMTFDFPLYFLLGERGYIYFYFNILYCVQIWVPQFNGRIISLQILSIGYIFYLLLFMSFESTNTKAQVHPGQQTPSQ